MKLTSQEEYGLRCLLRLARQAGSLTIPEISEAEGISSHYVAKLMRILRRGGFVTSARGQAGGYTLARTPEGIVVGEALALLGGRIFEPDFCKEHSGVEKACTNTVDCSIRSLWRTVQLVVDQVLARTTLKELVGNEQETTVWVGSLVNISQAGRAPESQLAAGR
ncbi:MAG TPA: Rrf2 family transcriptional regulator [Terriglobia bacterium]|nr:Rrf2 family transcriptional regulator [Terriglobia bacterium]